MKNISKLTLACIISVLPISLAYADQSDNRIKESKYIIKITAKDSKDAVPFTGSYLTMQKNVSRITRLDQVTPYELSVKADVVGLMLLSLGDTGKNNIKVEIDNNDQNVMLSATGVTILAQQDNEGHGSIIGK